MHPPCTRHAPDTSCPHGPPPPFVRLSGPSLPSRPLSCVPSVFSREAMLIGAQTGLLVLRTLLTDWIARVEGLSGSTLVSLVGGGEGGMSG